MQTNKILSASLLDLVFDGRNKEYGAYYLRVTYPQRIKKGLLIAGIITGLAFGGAALGNSVKKNNDNYRMKEVLELADLPKEKEPEKIVEPEKPKEVEQVKTEKVTVMIIKPDVDVETPPPSQDDIKDARIGDITIKDGRPDDGTPFDQPTPPGDGTGIIEPPKKTEPEIFTTVEIDAKFTGNWKAFLEKNLNPNVPVDNDAPPGSYSVVVRFVVDLEGNVSDIQTQTNHGYGMEAEAVRVLKKATKWEPAFQNGYHVKAYKKQVIVFQVLGDE